jgi:hypothetical protein
LEVKIIKNLRNLKISYILTLLDLQWLKLTFKQQIFFLFGISEQFTIRKSTISIYRATSIFDLHMRIFNLQGLGVPDKPKKKKNKYAEIDFASHHSFLRVKRDQFLQNCKKKTQPNGHACHWAHGCPMKDKDCLKCKTIGLLASVCMKSGITQPVRQVMTASSDTGERSFEKIEHIHFDIFSMQYHFEPKRYDNVFSIHKINTTAIDKFMLDIRVNQSVCRFELDTGAAAISMSDRNIMTAKLKTYTLNWRNY